jgi:hypothetical protein
MFFHHLTARSFDEVEGVMLAPGAYMHRKVLSFLWRIFAFNAK